MLPENHFQTKISAKASTQMSEENAPEQPPGLRMSQSGLSFDKFAVLNNHQQHSLHIPRHLTTPYKSLKSMSSLSDGSRCFEIEKCWHLELARTV